MAKWEKLKLGWDQEIIENTNEDLKKDLQKSNELENSEDEKDECLETKVTNKLTEHIKIEELD